MISTLNCKWRSESFYISATIDTIAAKEIVETLP